MPNTTDIIGHIRLRMQHYADRTDFTVYGVVAPTISRVGQEPVGVDSNDIAVIARIEQRDAKQLLDDIWALGIRPTCLEAAPQGDVYLQQHGPQRRRRASQEDLGDNYPVLHDVSVLE